MKNNLLLKSYNLWKFSYIFKIVLLLFLQVILGYFIIIVAYFTVKNNVNIFIYKLFSNLKNGRTTSVPAIKNHIILLFKTLFTALHPRLNF